MTNGEAVIADLQVQLEEAKANAEHGWTAAGAAADTIYDLRAQLASAREALEAVWFDQKKIGNCAPDTLDLVRAELSLTSAYRKDSK